MKKCFTINPYRTTAEFKTYYSLLKNRLYQGIEIFYPYILNDEDFSTYTSNALEIMKYAQEVVMHLPFGLKDDLCNMYEQDIVIKRMKQALDYGRQFNVKKYTLHLGYLHDLSRNQTITHITNVLQELCDYIYDANIMIENMANDSYIGHSPNEILNIITKVDRPNIKFILDIGHANISNYDIDDYINTLKRYLMHIHLHDNNGIRDEHTRIGSGNINFNKLLKQLSEYQELYCLEILYKDVNDLINYSNDLDNCIENKYDLLYN